MAVGLNKKEIDGPASQRAVACDLEPALPPIGARVTLNYPGKMDESIILQKKDTKYLRVGSDFAKESSLILPNSFIWSDNSLALNRLMVEGKKAKLIYLDPPYQGTSGKRDQRYLEGLSFNDCVDVLYEMKLKNKMFLISYDGMTGNKVHGKKLPENLKLKHFYINAGKSSQDILLGRKNVTFESLYLSEALQDKLLLSKHIAKQDQNDQKELRFA